MQNALTLLSGIRWRLVAWKLLRRLIRRLIRWLMVIWWHCWRHRFIDINKKLMITHCLFLGFYFLCCFLLVELMFDFNYAYSIVQVICVYM